jgi:hypothetical protein
VYKKLITALTQSRGIETRIKVIWKIILTGSLTLLAGAFIGMLIVRKLAKIMLVKQFNLLEYSLRSFGIVLLGSLAAFVASWETGYLLGKITSLKICKNTYLYIYFNKPNLIYSLQKK